MIELYILSDCEYKVKMYDMNNIKFIICILAFSKPCLTASVFCAGIEFYDVESKYNVCVHILRFFENFFFY